MVRRGLRSLVPLLKNNLGVTHSSVLPSINVLLPIAVLLGERPNEPLDTVPESRCRLMLWRSDHRQPYFFLSFLIDKHRAAKDWFHDGPAATGISCARHERDQS